MSDLRVAASLVRADLKAFIEMAVRTDDREAAVVGTRIAVLLNALERTRGWKFSEGGLPECRTDT